MNTNMRLVALILILIAPTWAVAQKFDPNVKLADLSPIYVMMMDNAKNGCWTNIGEAKTYAIDQIIMAGGSVTEDVNEAKAVFNVAIKAARMETFETCLGLMQVNIYSAGKSDGIFSYGKSDGIFHLKMYSDLSNAAINPDNFNTYALDHIKEAVGEWR